MQYVQSTSISCFFSCTWWESCFTGSIGFFMHSASFMPSFYWNRIQELPVQLQHLFVRVCHHHIATEIISLPLSKSLVQMVKLTDCVPSLQTSDSTRALVIHVPFDEATVLYLNTSNTLSLSQSTSINCQTSQTFEINIKYIYWGKTYTIYNSC